jgi:hypothetical protein
LRARVRGESSEVVRVFYETAAEVYEQAAADAHAREVLDRLRAWLEERRPEVFFGGNGSGTNCVPYHKVLRKLDDLEGR